MEDWNIQARSNVCTNCQTPFVEKENCYTILSSGNIGYQRQDLCRTCWIASGETLIREKLGVISYWQGAYEPPSLAPPDPLSKEDAQSILRRMLQRNDPTEVEARYILAVMLERKRILKHRETQKTAEKLLVYEYTETGEIFMIQDPQLRLDQLEEVQKRVSSMIKPASTVS